MNSMDKVAEQRLWDRYIDILKVAAVPEQARWWYVVRVERYLAVQFGHPLRAHTAATVRDYLVEAGRDAAMHGWLYRQLVHALWKLRALHRRGAIE